MVRDSGPKLCRDSLQDVVKKQMCRRNGENGVLLWRGLKFAVQIFGRWSLSISGAHNQGSSTGIRVGAPANRIAATFGATVGFAIACGAR